METIYALILMLLLFGYAAWWLHSKYCDEQLLKSNTLENEYLETHKELFEDKQLNDLYDLIVKNKVILDGMRIKPPYQRSYYYKLFNLIWASPMTDEEKRKHIIFYLHFIFEI